MLIIFENAPISTEKSVKISFFEYLYIYFACLSVRLYSINVKTAEPIGPTFFVGPHVTQGRFMNDPNFKSLPLKKIRFLKIKKIHKILL